MTTSFSVFHVSFIFTVFLELLNFGWALQLPVFEEPIVEDDSRLIDNPSTFWSTIVPIP